MRVKPNFRGPYAKPFPSRGLPSVGRPRLLRLRPSGTREGSGRLSSARGCGREPSAVEVREPGSAGIAPGIGDGYRQIVGLTSYPNIPILRSHVYPRSQGTAAGHAGPADSAHADFWIAGNGHSGKSPERGLPRTNPKVGSQVSHVRLLAVNLGIRSRGVKHTSQR